MNGYVTLTDAVSETVINKSRFIAFSFRIESEENAVGKIKALRKSYRDATHVCYAYVLKEGFIQRSNDDGEPAGSAGMPILEVIKGGGFSDTLVAVVRYFGGVKLGVGGLVRAYTQSAQAVIAVSKPLIYEHMSIFKLSLDYSDYSVYSEKFITEGYFVIDTEFDSGVTLTVAAKDGGRFKEFASQITKGKEPVFIEKRYILVKS